MENNAANSGQHQTFSQSVAQYLDQLEGIFDVDPPKMPSLRKADAVLNDYKSLKAVSEADIALFHLHYAECCVNHLDCFGGGPEDLYDAAGENFKAALDYAKKDRNFLNENAGLLKEIAYGFPGTEYLVDWLEDVLLRESRSTKQSKQNLKNRK